MEWMKAIGDAVQYMEEHITEDISPEAVAAHVNVSAFYFQKGFAMLCGFTVAEYLRNRRLALRDYEFAAGYCVEYYDDPAKYEKGTQDEKYYCEIWIPFKRK